MPDEFIPINITHNALVKVREIMNAKNIPQDYGLRIGVRATGCNGNSQLLGFDQSKKNDTTFDLEGIRILIAKKDFMYLVGLTLDYVHQENESGFIFFPSPE